MSRRDDDPPAFSDADSESLLERGSARDPRRERVIDNVLATLATREGRREGEVIPQPAPRRRGWRWRWPVALTAAAATAAAALVLVLRPRSPTDSGWQSRGGASAFAVEVGCAGAALDACPGGSTLLFRWQAPPQPAYLAAYAVPEALGRERVWYFSGAEAPLLGSGDGPSVLHRGIRIGTEHAPGSYVVHMLVLGRPLGPADLDHASTGDVLSEQKARLTVIP